MSQHVQWMDASYAVVEVVPERTTIGAGWVPDGHEGLVIDAGDDVVVIEGTRAALAALAQQISAQVAAAQRLEATLVIPGGAWEPVGEEDAPGGTRAILHATVVIGDTPHHAVAYEVRGSDPQSALQRNADLGYLNAATGGDGPFDTISLDGRTYALCLTPFSR